jgi:iron complex transport system substrate-binding protein
MLLALGEKDNIKGIESKATTRAIYEQVSINAKDYNVDGTGGIGGFGSKKGLDTELSISIGCDLAVIPYSLKDNADSYSQTIGAPVIVVNPESNDLMKECITLLGKATGNEERAKELNSYIETSISDMQEKITTTLPSVYLAGPNGILSTAGSKMYQNSLIINSVATNAAASITDASWVTKEDYEYINSLDIDVIVIAAESSLTVDDVLNDKSLIDVDAVDNNQVYKMPSTYEAWDSPVPSAFLGSLWLAAQYHSDYYTMTDFNKTLKDFYLKFYDVTITSDIT